MRLAMAISPSRREQLHRAHFAQVHAHRVVGAVVGAFLGGLDDRLLLAHGDLAALLLGGVVLGLDHIDAHFREHGEGVFDGLGGDFLGRQHLVQLVHGDVAAGLGLLDELLDPGVGQIEQRSVADRRFRRLGCGGFAHLALRTRPQAPMQGRRRRWFTCPKIKGPGVSTTRPHPKSFQSLPPAAVRRADSSAP